MEIYDRIEDLSRLVETARAVPLSTSCVLPRGDALDLLEEIRAALPAAVKDADEVLAQREELLDEAQRQSEHTIGTANQAADRTFAQARQEADDLVSDANRESADIIEDARADAESMLERARSEARRLIDEQEVLHRAQDEAAELVEQARQQGRAIVDDAEAQANDLIEAATSETSAERLATDEFVDGKLADLEESLAASLGAVRRGRDKIHARRAAYQPIDVRDHHQSDADLYDQVFEVSGPPR